MPDRFEGPDDTQYLALVRPYVRRLGSDVSWAGGGVGSSAGPQHSGGGEGVFWADFQTVSGYPEPEPEPEPDPEPEPEPEPDPEPTWSAGQQMPDGSAVTAGYDLSPAAWPDRPNDIPAGPPARPEQLIGPEMNKQEELARVIYNIRSSIPELHGVMVASTDGLAISHDFHESDAERIAAMAATALGLGKRMTERTNLGSLQETVVRGDHGYLVVYAAGENAVIVMSGPSTSNLGLMRIEARSASTIVSKVLG